MSQGHDTQVLDEQFIADLIDDLGGVATLPEGEDEFLQAVKRMWAERDSLVERHPGKWVAVGKDGIVSVGDSIEEVLSVADAENASRPDLVVEYLVPNPAALIL